MFVIAGGIVAFHGWPTIAGQPSPNAVALNAAPGDGARGAHRLSAVLATVVLPVTRVTPRRRVTRAPGGHGRPRVRPSGSNQPTSVGTGTHGSPITVTTPANPPLSVTVSDPTKPPISVTVTTPTKPPISVIVTTPAKPPVTSPTGQVGTVVTKVGDLSGG